MTAPTETLHTGAPWTCKDCGVTVELDVMFSPAGYYVGSQCQCGPYSRETDYLRTPSEAQRELEVLLVTGDCRTLRRLSTEYRPPSIRRDH